MKATKWFIMLAIVTILAIALSTQVTYAQRGRGGGFGGGGRGDLDPAQMEALMMTQQQQMLGATDEEWAVIGPLVKKVNNARMAARGGGFGGRMRAGGQQGMQRQGSGDQGSSMRPGGGNEMPEEAALGRALENPNTSADEIQRKLVALRKAREMAKQRLITAQEELRQVLTLRQEAQCVLMGTLD